MARVRALRDHTEPKVHTFRQEGEEFEYSGKEYEHIEPVNKKSKAARAGEETPETMESAGE